MGKECGFLSNFDMPRPFTPRKTELQPIKSPNGLLHLKVEQRTHSGDEIGTKMDLGYEYISNILMFVMQSQVVTSKAGFRYGRSFVPGQGRARKYNHIKLSLLKKNLNQMLL